MSKYGVTMAKYKDIEQRTETQQTPVVANQQEYINKQALLDELEKISFGKHGQLERAVAERVFLAIDRMPAADVVPREEVDEWKERVEVLERALEDAEDVLSFVLRWSDIHPQNQKIMRKTKQDFISYALCIKAAELKKKYESEGEG